jgi:hypothetical protein
MSPIDRLVFIQLTIAFPVFAQGLPVTPADQAAGQAWWAHIKVLADDGMQGRLTGSEGYVRAAKYVVSQFNAMGLQPAGVNGYYQPVKFDVTRVIAGESSMSLVVDGRSSPLPSSSSGTDSIYPRPGTTISIRRKCPLLL